MLWCAELETAENFGLTSIQKPLIAISKCPLLNIHPVLLDILLLKKRYHLNLNVNWGGPLRNHAILAYKNFGLLV